MRSSPPQSAKILAHSLVVF